MKGVLLLVVLVPLTACESDAPKVAPPQRVDAGALRAEATKVEVSVEAELNEVEAQATQAAPPLPDMGAQKLGVNE